MFRIIGSQTYRKTVLFRNVSVSLKAATVASDKPLEILRGGDINLGKTSGVRAATDLYSGQSVYLQVASAGEANNEPSPVHEKMSRHNPAVWNVQQRRAFSVSTSSHDKERVLLNDFRSKNYRLEGTDVKRDPLCVADRSELFDFIYGKLRTNKAVLFKGPPGSGKTSTGHLLKHYTLETGKYKTVYNVVGTIDEPGLIQQLQEQNPNVSCIYDLTNVKEPTLLIVDEAQLTFGLSMELGHAQLWEDIKNLMSDRHKELDILVIASHGENAIGRCQFNMCNTVFADAVAFTRKELLVMARQWNKLDFARESDAGSPPVKMSEILPLSEAVMDALHDLTAGHVGLCRLMVESLGDMFLDPNLNKEQKFPVAEEAIIAALHSDFMMERVLASRAVPQKWLSEDEPTVQRILTEQSVRAYGHCEPKRYESLMRLIRSGLVAEDRAEHICFTSPLLKKIAQRKLHPDS